MLLMTHGRRILVIAFTMAAACEHRLVASTLCVEVMDPANLPLPNAWVNIVGLATNKLYTARTDRKGRACVSRLPEGLYSVESGLTGFLNVRYYPVRVTYPATHELQFRLPFGEITEGGLSQEATVTGTLKQGDTPVQSASICIFGLQEDTPITCTVTNDLGEYALSLPPKTYRVEVRISGGEIQRSKIDVSTAGSYRNLITVTPKQKEHY
jgi:hypothetical protein